MDKKSDLKIYNFYFFKLREKFAEKQSTESFLVRKDNVNQSVDICFLS